MYHICLIDTKGLYLVHYVQVYEIYSKQFGDHSSQEGLHIQQLFKILSSTGANIPMNHLRALVNDLAEDGKIYSTIDDDHHTVTDAGGY